MLQSILLLCCERFSKNFRLAMFAITLKGPPSSTSYMPTELCLSKCKAFPSRILRICVSPLLATKLVGTITFLFNSFNF